MHVPGAASNVPFGRGSVSIRLYPHNELPATEIVRELCAQANLAVDSGFDGVMTSEHHGGFAGYLAQPLQMASFVLDAQQSGWAAAAPLLLPLRATALVAEEVAWLNARFPGRVGLGVAMGALPLDFEVAAVEQSEAAGRFKAALPRMVAMLRGEDLGPLAEDPALRACRATPVPVVSAAVSAPQAAVRARPVAAPSILMEGMSEPERLATLCAAYDEAGGTGAKVLIRRVWLGQVDRDLVANQRAVYESYAGAGQTFSDDQTVAAAEPAEMVERLTELVALVGADALNLRVQLPGMSAAAVREQIAALGSSVAAPLKEAWLDRR